MNNKYKKAMSGVRHSDELVERIFDMTVDKKIKKGQTFKRLASGFLALAILIGGGFGTNAVVQNNKANKPLSVMVAYASDGGKLSFGSKSEQKLFYGIYTAPIDDKTACKNAVNRWNKDYAELMKQLDEKAEGSSASYGRGSSACYSKTLDRDTAVFYTLEGGMFELSLEDYSNVKSFKVENESQYGLLQFDYYNPENESYYDELVDSGWEAETEEEQYALLGWSHSFEITGEELRFSQENGCYENGLGKYKENKGYFLNWEPSEELKAAIGENPKFDLSQIKDAVTFTVEFNDGTVKTASLNLYFDSDGYMHFK